MAYLNTAPLRRAAACSRRGEIRTGLLGTVFTVGVACALATAFSPAADAKPRLGAKPKSEAAAKIGVKAGPNAARLGARFNPRAYKLGGRFKRKDGGSEHVGKDPFGPIPEGPLQIVISINQQQLHLYSDGVHIADTPVATGVVEHPTPLGVFSVIDKERYHESNIYSGAPMPYMQRITWSGVAMHQGNGAGHRASHGCIRLPEAFAARLWVLHSLGARVVIARPDLTLEEIADPHLFAHKEAPRPAPTAAIETVKTAQTIDGSRTSDALAPAIPSAGVDGAAKKIDPAEPAKPVAADLHPTIGQERASDAVASHGADASAAWSDPKPTVGRDAASADPPVAPVDPKLPGNESASADASVVTIPAAAADAPHPLAAAPSGKPTPPVRTGLQNAKPAETVIDGAAKPALDATLEVVPVPSPKPSDLIRGAIGAPIAIFVSRKTSRIYVRQRFAPLFDAAVVVDRPAEPIGTHVFTALEYLNDGSTFHWNVISLPGEPKPAHSEKESVKWTVDRYGRWSKLRRQVVSDVAPVDTPPPQTPREALARIEIPQPVIDRISELMVAGSSLVVSDQGLGEETGQGTDFVVVTR